MSERSEQIGELAAALAKAQGEMENAPKSSRNPFFNSKYADLAGILNMVRPCLSKNGIAVIQHPSFEGGSVSVQTFLVHSSGQWVSSSISAPVAKSDAQGIGSATTYCRRYALSAIAGIAQEDDDDTEGEAEVKNRGKTNRANYKFWFTKDVQKAVSICKMGYHPNSCRYNIRPNSELFISWARSVRKQNIYFDIETEPTTNQVTCFSVSTGPEEVWTIPIISYKQTLAYDHRTTAAILGGLCFLFNHNNIVIHNAMFDLFILLWMYKIPLPPRISCTMSMWHRVQPEVEKSLGHLISAATHEIYHKDESNFRPMSAAQEHDQLLYNAKDVERLALIYPWILSEAEKVGATESCRQVNESLSVYLQMTYRGLRLDTPKLCSHIDGLTRRVKWFEEKVLTRLCGFYLNPRSPVQVADYLYNKLGFEKPKISPGDKYNTLTGKKQLYKLLLKHDVPSLKVILALRRWSREKGQLSFRHWREDGVVTCSYSLWKKTFRSGSSVLLRFKSNKNTGFGTNLQNWRKQIRELVVPFDSGGETTLFQIDQAGAEALIVAYLCRSDNKLRQLFTHKVKVHSYVAAHLFADHWRLSGHKCIDAVIRCDIKDIKTIPGWVDLEKAIKESDNDIPSKRFYYMAKQTVHSSNYGIKAPTFVMNVLDKSEGQVVIPLVEGKRFLDTYHNIFPEIRQWHNDVAETLKKARTLRNLFGYPRIFNGYVTDDTVLKDAYSWIPQSTVGCITHIAARELCDIAAKRKDFCVLKNDHDSLLLEVENGAVEDVSALAMTSMARELINDRGERFKMGAEIQIGKNWGMKS